MKVPILNFKGLLISAEMRDVHANKISALHLEMNSCDERNSTRTQLIKNLESAIRGYLARSIDELSLGYSDLSDFSPFRLKVLMALRANVKRGETISYGELAKLAGSPSGARAVGAVMSWNPFPLFFPCHRVIAADGSAGGFQAGPEAKQILMSNERRLP